jgi:hypothetical protein
MTLPTLPARRRLLLASLVLAALSCGTARADTFDRYTNSILGKVAEAEGVQTPAKVTPQLLADSGKLLPGSSAALIVIKTNGGRYSKLALQIARQRTPNGQVPIALVERFVTFKEGDERALQATGGPIHLYSGFQLNLDLGQVVPAEVGGDLKFVSENGQSWLEPVGMAKLYLLTKPLPGTEVKKLTRPMIGEVFEPRFFSGTYKLLDDGRRAAKLILKVDDDGTVSGEYISDMSGRSYEVYGKVANPKHQITFTVKFPQTEQTFQGWMFTHEGKMITGSTRMQEREFGWVATRQDEE